MILLWSAGSPLTHTTPRVSCPFRALQKDKTKAHRALAAIGLGVDCPESCAKPRVVQGHRDGVARRHWRVESGLTKEVLQVRLLEDYQCFLLWGEFETFAVCPPIQDVVALARHLLEDHLVLRQCSYHRRHVGDASVEMEQGEGEESEV